ncbi:MAG: hypothetical protein QM581_12750 [Pseudomonas sp.]
MSTPAMRRRSLTAAAIGLALFAGLGVAALLGVRLDNTPGGLVIGMAASALFSALVLWFRPDDRASSALTRRYRRELVPALLAYVAVMLVWRHVLDGLAATWLRVLVALLPALLVLWVIRAKVRYVRDSDELQRRIELESAGIAAGLVGGGYMVASFLQSAGLIDVQATSAMLWVFPALCLVYAIARLLIARRYT